MNTRQRKRNLYWPLRKDGRRKRFDRYLWALSRTFRKFRPLIAANIERHNALRKRLQTLSNSLDSAPRHTALRAADHKEL